MPIYDLSKLDIAPLDPGGRAAVDGRGVVDGQAVAPKVSAPPPVGERPDDRPSGPLVAPVVARVNGIALNSAGEVLPPEELRQRACTELLRQAACAAGLLDAQDPPAQDGAISEAASAAIETLLERSLKLPEPQEADCKRHYEAHAGAYSTGERVRVRHVLFAVTPGMDVVLLRKRAEAALLDLRCHDGSAAQIGEASANAADAFARGAAEWSNCPSGANGGDLGWLSAADFAPEFARELFGKSEVGVLPRLVHSRFGLHVVEVLEREAGVRQPFEMVRGAVTNSLRQQAYVTALRQYLRLLAGKAVLEGVELEAAGTPLVQ